MITNKKKESAPFPKVEREDWSAEKISNESSNQMPDEIVRQVLRGDESKGDANNRDITGSSEVLDTPQGREEAKNNIKNK